MSASAPANTVLFSFLAMLTISKCGRLLLILTSGQETCATSVQTRCAKLCFAHQVSGLRESICAAMQVMQKSACCPTCRCQIESFFHFDNHL